MTREKWINKSATPTYNSWKSMRNRVLFNSSDSHVYYKKKNIKICKEWINDYDRFFEDMGERPFGTQLDRINSNGNYCKDNCRWVSPRVQQNNKDCLTKIEHNGIVKTIGEWSFELCLSEKELHRIYKRYSCYGARTFDELFCESRLNTYRIKKRLNMCVVCKRIDSIKWRKNGRLCNTCYHRGLRWSKKNKEDINSYHEFLALKGEKYE